jgi:D-beta-D-heptose 7-phosphate kinase/D-beta-D-heptose 1-phosphate adenosyltransferase
MKTGSLQSRLLGRAALARMRGHWRRKGKRVVFTNGVFDILHRGHLDILSRAKSFGDILVVGLNSDASVRRLKGPTRPLNRQRDRALMLLALRMVDFVCIFGEDTPLELIRALRPDVLVKGAEYATGHIVGASEVHGWGGRVRRVTMRRGYSTTGLLKRIGGPK